MESKNIFLVEDDTSMRQLLHNAFAEEGFDVESAKDGEEAIEKLQRITPDMILLDIILPKKDGFEVLQFVREYEALKNVPVVLLTNLERSEDIEKALSLGATTYMVKSNYTLQEIVERIRSLS